MNIWMVTTKGYKHSINESGLMAYDNIYELAMKIYSFYESYIKKYKNSFTLNKIATPNFENYLLGIGSSYIVYNVEMNVKKKKMNYDELIELFNKDIRVKKILTKSMLKN